MTKVTEILNQIESGDPSAAEALLPLVYAELRQLAARRLANEKPGQTLQATALVHEVYIRLIGNDPGKHWDGRGHFFAAAAEAMRRIMIDLARKKSRLRHGHGWQRVDINDGLAIDPERANEIIALDEALASLAEIDPKKAELVKLRFFCGMTIPEASKVLDISHATAERHWKFARVWLFERMHEP